MGGYLCAALFLGCSTQKNTPGTRAYHELTTRYNIYFNAEEAYEESLRSLIENHKEDYRILLPMYPDFSGTSDGEAKPLGGPFDRSIEKCTKAIQEHSIAAKPRRDRLLVNSREYRDWLRRSEFNPFIHKAWLLMGKAHVQNRDYTEAVSVFSQTVRLFGHDLDVVSEAQIWMMRAYTEMEWFSDAETIAATLRARPLSDKYRALFSEFYAFLLMQKGEHRESIPFLIEAIDNQKNISQKQRFQFLLGQLYAVLGENENAYRAFEKLKSLSTPYDMEFNARMAQSQVSGDDRNTIDELRKMLKSPKNAEYLDRIYSAIGRIYLLQNDTVKAAENYLLAERNSLRKGIDKALAQVALGDIYFNRKEFIKAQLQYSEALGLLPENNENYSRVGFRANVLKDLVPHLSAVQEQDSLQLLTQLPEPERLKIINDRIAELKKREREQMRSEEIETRLSEQQSRQYAQQPFTAIQSPQDTNGDAESLFYFYNPQRLLQGKNEFRRRWGNRELTDNWRLQNRGTSNPESPSLPEEPSSANDVAVDAPVDLQASDPYSPEFYLQRLPLTPQAVEASNSIIEEGLFHIGNIAGERLEDFDYAVKTYNRHLNDFPRSTHRASIYHRLYLIYLRKGDRRAAHGFKNKIIVEFPESQYAAAMSDSRYESVMRNYARAEDSLYQQTYRAYLQGQPQTVQHHFQEAQKLFANGKLMPKFLLLNALSFAQTGDVSSLKRILEELIGKYSEAEESIPARHILSGLSEGKTPTARASAVSDMYRMSDAVASFGNEADTLRFDAEKEQLHNYLLLFSPSHVKRSNLLFTVSDYNFTNFRLRTFSTDFIRFPTVEALRIKPFHSFEEALQYSRMIENDSVFVRKILSDVTPVLISDANIEILNKGKSLDEYLSFYHTVLHEKQKEGQIYPTDSTLDVQATEQRQAVTEPEKVVPLDREKSEEPIPVAEASPPPTPEQRRAELERKAEQMLLDPENTLPQKGQNKLRKEHKQVLKEQKKQRERELKEKEKARKEALKQRERERRQKLKEQERLRRERLRQRKK